jgi:glycosyltransferase involved in cell wall biosynthesis
MRAIRTKEKTAESVGRQRLAILTNIVAPYRLPVYLYLADRFDTVLIEGQPEDNRNWASELALGSLTVKRAWGFQVVRQRTTAVSGVTDANYIQINLGVAIDLPKAKPDVILTNEMGTRTVLALLYGWLTSTPVWIWSGVTIHTERNVGRTKRALRAAIASIARHWISYGEAASEYLLSLGIPRERILQIQNCVKESDFEPAEPVRQRGEALLRSLPKPIGLCVGQLIARKGFTLLLESAARLQKAGMEFSLAFAGTGADEQQLKDMTLRLGLRNIRYLGSLAQKDVRSLYQSSAFLVFPSLEEVWGLVVNEALWSGLSVLCSKYAGCARELVPTSAQFDPLDASSFDAALGAAVQGSLESPDHSRLLPMDQVAKMIVDSVQQGTPVRTPTHQSHQSVVPTSTLENYCE